MGKNKTGKYLKYAIGEIALVVIGILIALSINNWNLQNIADREEKQLLENLQFDFQNALKDLQEVQQIRHRTIAALKEMYEIRASKIIPDEETFYQTFMQANMSTTTNVQTGSLDVLINSGKINSLSNEALKKLLFSWPAVLSDMIEEEFYVVDMQIDFTSSPIAQNFSSSKLYRALTYRDYPFHEIPEGTNQTDFEALFTDPFIENYWATRMVYIIISIGESKRLIEMAEEIIENVDQQLGN